MKKLFILILMLCFSTPLFAFDSESGSGVVSAQEVIVRTSLEATQVLQSDTLTNLYGVTILGGASNYASFDSGGVLTLRNVTSSGETVLLGNNQRIEWLKSNVSPVRVGVSADDIFTIPIDTRVIGRTSGNEAVVTSVYTTSIDTTNIKVSGGTTITSTYATGSCSFTFNNGLLTTATC